MENFNLQNFCIPNMITCMCLLSHPLLEHLCIFHADYLEVFFHLNSYNTYVIMGGKIRRFGIFHKNK